MKANWIIRTLSAAAVSLALGGAAYAGNYPDFSVDESTVPGCTDAACGLLNPSGTYGGAAGVDRINGLFTEIFVPTFNTATSGTFVSTAIFDMTSYFQNDVPVPAFLGSLGTNGYGMYALFTASGNFSISGTQTTFSGANGTINVYINPDQSTDRTATGDDYLIASAVTVMSGSGQFDSGGSTGTPNGNFEIIWKPVSLTTNPTTCPAPNAAQNACNGEAYFPAPRPFYIIVDANGNFTEDPLTTQGPISGSANAFFMKVPEPNTLLLLGIAVLGAGITIRRRKTQ